MKRSLILIAALLAGAAVHADSWEQPNLLGGKIVLTDRSCDDGKYKNLMAAYAYTATGEVTNGCWGPLDGNVHISWNNAKQSVFPQDAFIATPGNKQAGKKPAVAPL